MFALKHFKGKSFSSAVCFAEKVPLVLFNHEMIILFSLKVVLYCLAKHS